jgi:hypothetical protein
MATTPHLILPYLEPAQAQKHVTVNESLRRLDATVQLSVADRDLGAPPPSPEDGERFIVAAPASGAWAGQEDTVAAWQDGAWEFYAPQTGWLAWIDDEEVLAVWDGSAWAGIVSSDTSAGLQNLAMVGINTTADVTNRLAIASEASLFNHAGAGHQHKINKATAGDTASVLYQTGFSGRAEMGTTGDDDYHFKVSPDGSTWHEAIVIDKDTGEVTLPVPTATRREVLQADRTYYVRTAGAPVTMTVASPAVVTWTAHGLQADDPVVFSLPADRASCTITIASPGVVTANGHGFADHDPVKFSTTGTLPTGLTAGTTYFVVNATTNTFQVEASIGGGSINTSGSQTGSHFVERASTLPTGVTAGTIYYVLAAGLATDTFRFAATPGGAAINSSGSTTGKITAATGNDSNDGLTQSRTGAFLSIQKAIDTIRAKVDFGAYKVTVQLGDGIYLTGVKISGSWMPGEVTDTQNSRGEERLTLRGNPTSPANVHISTTSATCIQTDSFARVHIDGLKLQTTTSGHCINSHFFAAVTFKNVIFGPATVHLECFNGVIVASGNYTIAGNASFHIQTYYHGFVYVSGRTITITGNPTFTFFVVATNAGFAQIGSNTWSGSATGTRYFVNRNGVLQTDSTVETYVPGNANGRHYEGGVIDGTVIPKLRAFTVATVPSASIAGAGALIYVSDGDGGNKCIAMSDGSAWKRIVLGATVSNP